MPVRHASLLDMRLRRTPRPTVRVLETLVLSLPLPRLLFLMTRPLERSSSAPFYGVGLGGGILNTILLVMRVGLNIF